MRVLITDGNNRASLAITRSLGSQGHEIFIANTSHPSLASCSKYCAHVITHPDPIENKSAFIRTLFDVIANHKIDVVLPVSDISTLSIAENIAQLPTSCDFPFSNIETLRKAADKNYVTNLANKLNVPAPKTLTLANKEYTPNDLQHLNFPIVIKPARSRVFTSNGKWILTGVSYACDMAALERDLNRRHAAEFPVLLQERISGPGVGIFVCYDKGNLKAAFSHRRLKEKPPSGGVSVLRESIELNPDALKHAKKLLDTLQWHGVGMVEFKQDKNTGIPYLMEINGRFWGSLQLAIDSGVDFPSLLVASQSPTANSNETVTQLPKYQIGIQSRWLLGDIDRLLMLLLKSRSELMLPEGHPGKVKSLLEFLKLWGKNLRYEILRLEDIRPFIYELKRWLFRS